MPFGCANELEYNEKSPVHELHHRGLFLTNSLITMCFLLPALMQKKPKSYSPALMDQIPIKHLIRQAQGLQQELGGKGHLFNLQCTYFQQSSFQICSPGVIIQSYLDAILFLMTLHWYLKCFSQYIFYFYVHWFSGCIHTNSETFQWLY